MKPLKLFALPIVALVLGIAVMHVSPPVYVPIPVAEAGINLAAGKPANPTSAQGAAPQSRLHWTGDGIDLMTRDDGYSDCRHLMEERSLHDGWAPATLALGGSPPVKGCMHIYGKYDLTWDHNQYSDRVFGFCPIEGGSLIEGCVTIPPLQQAE